MLKMRDKKQCIITVLEKETGGYRAFVLPWSGNTVWEYNVEEG